ncbi:hypothetical protein [Arcicella rosea]|uniref:Outer membrane protein beta-barrel domain-containing protein n=1 Tax=Arcicella rosea TaxID=502909 RepID=A0A841EV45_9BACT|nr:hypothetical protein [Arcicella rosea]MBB6004170.1 hypothetical protein [Arcicella rosea]
MKKILLTVLITVLSHLTIKAQKEFMSGYVINNTGDTISGQIDNQKWVYSPLKITFKKDDQEVKYGLSDIQGFVINNEVTYVRKAIALDITPHQLGSLIESYDRVVVDTTLFLKQLVKGRLSLYYLQDINNKKHFFIEKLNEPIKELIDHRFLRTIDYRTYNVHLDIYNKQLYDLCEDCSNYSGKVFKYLYRDSDLIPLVIKYNIYFGDNKPVEVSKKEKFKSTLFIQAAVGAFGYTIGNSPNEFKKAGLMSGSFGLGGLFEIPSKRRRFGIKADLLYNFYEEDVRLFSSYVIPTNTSYLGAYIGPQYSIYKNVPKKVDIYINAAVSLEIRLAEKSQHVYYQGLGNTMGFKVGVGTRLNKMNLELTYNNTDAGLKPYPFISGTIQKVSLGLSYALGKNK